MKNPTEIYSIVRNQTFAVSGTMTAPTMTDGDEPLRLHHNTFSRFNFCLINKEKKATTSSLHVNELTGIYLKSKFAYNKQLERQYMGMSIEKAEETKEDETKKVSSAYTVQISSGNLKGKTPAQVLLENPENMQEQAKKLINQFEFLKKNTDEAYTRD